MRRFEASDYKILCGWWEAWNFPAPPIEFLPMDGYVCNEMAAGFLYLSPTPLAWMEWVVSDPKAEKKIRGIAVDALIGYICERAKAQGVQALFTSTNKFPFCERIKKLGFVVGDSNTTQLIRRL